MMRQECKNVPAQNPIRRASVDMQQTTYQPDEEKEKRAITTVAVKRASFALQQGIRNGMQLMRRNSSTCSTTPAVLSYREMTEVVMKDQYLWNKFRSEVSAASLVTNLAVVESLGFFIIENKWEIQIAHEELKKEQELKKRRAEQDGGSVVSSVVSWAKETFSAPVSRESSFNNLDSGNSPNLARSMSCNTRSMTTSRPSLFRVGSEMPQNSTSENNDWSGGQDWDNYTTQTSPTIIQSSCNHLYPSNTSLSGMTAPPRSFQNQDEDDLLVSWNQDAKQPPPRRSSLIESAMNVAISARGLVAKPARNEQRSKDARDDNAEDILDHSTRSLPIRMGRSRVNRWKDSSNSARSLRSLPQRRRNMSRIFSRRDTHHEDIKEEGIQDEDLLEVFPQR